MDEIVQSGEVSDGTTSTEETTSSAGGETQPQPLTEEVKQLIAEESKKAREEGKREMQGTKDKEVAQALSRVKTAEDALAAVGAGFREVDPEAAESSIVKAQLKNYQARENEERQRQGDDAFRQTFYDSAKQFIVSLDIKLDDPRIDWGQGANTMLEVRKRIDTSIATIQKENSKVAADKIKQEAEDKIAQVEKDAGYHSHDTSVSSGAGGKLTKEKIQNMTPSEVSENYEEINKFFGN